MNTRTVETVVLRVERMKSSRNGNPRKVLHTADDVYSTPVDSMIAYAIGDDWAGMTVRLGVSPYGVIRAVYSAQRPGGPVINYENEGELA